MTNISRRQFLAGVAGVAAMPLTGRPAPSNERFEMLVIGDSLIWGQGLREEEKSYRILHQYLESEILRKPINLQVLAHSGAALKLTREEHQALSRTEIDRTSFHPEINISFPTVMDQLDAAVKHYGNVDSVDLVLLSGGVPDIGVINILDPFSSPDALRNKIRYEVGVRLREVIDRTARSFPRAAIGVVGYYPIITEFTPMRTIINDVLEVFNWPGWTKPLLNNQVNRVWLRRYRRRMIDRSEIWMNESTAILRDAVESVNRYTGDRIVFVLPPFEERHGYGAPETLLWQAGEGGMAQDPRAADRRTACRPELTVLRGATNLRYRTRVCELASIGHPNTAGAAAIAGELKKSLVTQLI
ncbi:MAG TPA: twin-arginine translocation signal domain-containing protein [Pyrinomonadaceae bacterium]|nr:twin-arginine translocation signal domain-containing protein [Pyrinomonadaceae bacterium]